MEINDPAQLRAAEFVLDYPASKYSHAMASLVRQLESRDGAAIVAMTSVVPDEGRSAIGVSLARAAANGYALNRGEWRESVGGVAAPIFDAFSQPVAAIGISGPLERLTLNEMRELARHIAVRER